MKPIKVAAGILNQTPLDWDSNRANIITAIRQARETGVGVLCLPELCISGYGCEDAFHAPFVHQTAWTELNIIAGETTGMAVAVGLPVMHQNSVFNCACLLVDGVIAGFVAKKFLAGDGIHYEPRWFKPWPSGVQHELRVDGRSYPFGDVFFDLDGLRIGFEICEDAWVANRPGASLASKGVDVIFNPSASHFAFGKLDVRKRFVLEGSRAFGATYVYSNHVGNEAGRAIYDGGALIASGGKLVAAGPRFSFQGVTVTSAVVDIQQTRLSQARTTSHQPGLTSSDAGCVRLKFAVPATAFEPAKIVMAPWENSAELKAEEFARAEALALFDYMRKSRLHGFVVSLSGGVDSAAVTCLAGLSVRMGIAELGLNGFLKKLGYAHALREHRDVGSVIRALLTCVYQGTENSSATTRDAARAVAQAVGAEFLEFEVGELVERYTSIVSGAIGRPLTWATDDIALQNIQARVRAPGVWFLANLRNALLLSTSNRSEAAVGYATMDGDTCGGLSPIAGIDKAYLRQWLVWMEQHGPDGIGALPALRLVNAQAPTAELRPAEQKQTDEGDLMPYTVLDACERAFIRDKKGPAEVLASIGVQFPQYKVDQMKVWVTRFFRLWSRNQWKRERYAPSFHLDDESLDPKTWCRYPILSGGFARELSELNT
ncbi:NAD(+) synthase [Opitutus terrae]|uniref:Glutamine-dependent NAD(+) synthetase n=1 Tax=Opitutus terrae (strain DSM 11246 / JCM 15787 / PB90-1) TaxID=452637 RepID=B1ZMI8_OPITP|nr:NAD(+) synthase [Opitutus terrae]ACB74333.1 NAD+ synthetase [Opitutus terrae PB90-1]